MDDNIINTNTDEIVLKWQKAYSDIEEINRRGNDAIISSMENTTRMMGGIYERFVDKYRLEAGNIIRITEELYKTMADIDDKFTREKVDKLESQVSVFKKALEEEIASSREVSEEKMNIAEKELANVKEKAEERKEVAKKEVEDTKEYYKGLIDMKSASSVGSGARSVTSGINTAMGGQTGSFGEVLGMGADTIGGLALLASVNYGEGVKQLANVAAKLIGMYVQLAVKHASEERSLLDYTAAGEAPGGEDILTSVHDLGVAFAGQAEFEFGRVVKNLQTMAASRQFGELGGQQKQLDFYTQNTLMGMSQGVGPEEMISITSDLKEKLKIPIDEVSGVFSQLSLISKDLQRPLKEVISDFTSLHRDSQRYGYSREQEMGMIVRFNDELKTGVMSISDLSEAMRGMSGQSQEGATGTAAMLKDKSIRGELLQQVKKTGGSVEDAQEILGMLDQMDEVTGGMGLRVLNNPEAKGPFVSALKKQIKEQTGMGQGDLERLNPQVEKLVYAFGDLFADQQGGSLGTKQLLLEKIMPTLGMPMDNNLTKQEKDRDATIAVGTEDKVRSFGNALDEVTKQQKAYTDIMEKEAISGVKKFINAFDLLLVENQEVMKQYMDGTITLKDAAAKLRDNFNKLSESITGSKPEGDFSEGFSLKKLFDPTTLSDPKSYDVGGAMKDLGSSVWEGIKKTGIFGEDEDNKKEFSLKITHDAKEFGRYNEAEIKQMVDKKMLDPSMIEIFKQILSKNR